MGKFDFVSAQTQKISFGGYISGILTMTKPAHNSLLLLIKLSRQRAYSE
jgi:hypothetical protein